MLLHCIAWYCMVPICIDTVIVILIDWCDIGVVGSDNLKKLPSLHAGFTLAHYGVNSSYRKLGCIHPYIHFELN